MLLGIAAHAPGMTYDQGGDGDAHEPAVARTSWCTSVTHGRGVPFDLSGYSQEQLDAIADQINNRPRKGLGVRSPLAVYRELLLNSTQHSTLVH
jgi:hypothetical protein